MMLRPDLSFVERRDPDRAITHSDLSRAVRLFKKEGFILLYNSWCLNRGGRAEPAQVRTLRNKSASALECSSAFWAAQSRLMIESPTTAPSTLSIKTKPAKG
jgi:hypothetical protein